MIILTLGASYWEIGHYNIGQPVAGMSDQNEWYDRRNGNSRTAKIPLKPYC